MNYYMNEKKKVKHLRQNDPKNTIHNRRLANRAKIRAEKRKIRIIKYFTAISVLCIIMITIIILSNF